MFRKKLAKLALVLGLLAAPVAVLSAAPAGADMSAQPGQEPGGGCSFATAYNQSIGYLEVYSQGVSGACSWAVSHYCGNGGGATWHPWPPPNTVVTEQGTYDTLGVQGCGYNPSGNYFVLHSLYPWGDHKYLSSCHCWYW